MKCEVCGAETEINHGNGNAVVCRSCSSSLLAKTRMDGESPKTQQEDGINPNAHRNAQIKKPANSARRLVVLLSMAVILLFLNVFGRLWPGAKDFFEVPSSSEYTEAETECERFVKDNFGKHFGDDTEVFDTYRKRGKIVVEVGYREAPRSQDRTSYSLTLCVYDAQERTVMLPGAFNMEAWRK